MRLDELTPRAVTFNVSGLELTYRPFTIADDLKAADICGGREEMKKAFDAFDFEKISIVCWYQLDIESQKRIVQSVEAETVDHVTGEVKKVNLKPIEKFRHLFRGVGDQIKMITELVRSKGLNLPDFDDDEALKNWSDQLVKEASLTGR